MKKAKSGGAWRILGLVAAILVLLSPMASGQGATNVTPVLVEADPGTPLVATFHDESQVRFAFNLTNLNSETPFYVSVIGGKGLEGWTVTATPNKFFAAPRNGSATPKLVVVRMSFSGGDAPEHTTGDILFHITDTRTGATSEVPETVSVTLAAGAKIVGLFVNPLPAPLNNDYGVFLLDLVVYTGIAVAVLLAGDVVVRYFTRFAKTEVTKVILHKLRVPIFVLVLLLGVRESFAALPASGFTTFVREILAVLAVAILGLYVAYKVLDSALYYYGAEIAPKTETKIDDVLVPAIRKVSVVFLVIFGIGYSVRVLFGLDLSFFIAGAGIAGLVIAFAAQDTLSNFFSGIFLLLDQPFAEGDDIQIETGEICRVDTIGLRSTRLYHHTNHERIVLPNNQLASRRIINLSAPDTKYRLNIPVGVAYGSRVDEVQRILGEVALATPGVLNETGFTPVAFFKDLGDSALNFEWRVYISHWRERHRLRSELLSRAYAALNQAGIDIPFPQRVVWMKTAPEGDAAPAKSAGAKR